MRPEGLKPADFKTASKIFSTKVDVWVKLSHCGPRGLKEDILLIKSFTWPSTSFNNNNNSNNNNNTNNNNNNNNNNNLLVYFGCASPNKALDIMKLIFTFLESNNVWCKIQENRLRPSVLSRQFRALLPEKFLKNLKMAVGHFLWSSITHLNGKKTLRFFACFIECGMPYMYIYTYSTTSRSTPGHFRLFHSSSHLIDYSFDRTNNFRTSALLLYTTARIIANNQNNNHGPMVNSFSFG